MCVNGPVSFSSQVFFKFNLYSVHRPLPLSIHPYWEKEKIPVFALLFNIHCGRYNFCLRLIYIHVHRHSVFIMYIMQWYIESQFPPTRHIVLTSFKLKKKNQVHFVDMWPRAPSQQHHVVVVPSCLYNVCLLLSSFAIPHHNIFNWPFLHL